MDIQRENIKNKLEEIKKNLIKIQENQNECDKKIKEIDSYFRLRENTTMTEKEIKMYLCFSYLLLISYLAVLFKGGFSNNLSYLNFLIIGLEITTYTMAFSLKKWYYKQVDFLNNKYAHFLKLADSRLEYEKKILFEIKKDYMVEIDNILSLQNDYLEQLNVSNNCQKLSSCIDNNVDYSNIELDSSIDDLDNVYMNNKEYVKIKKKIK